MLELHASPNSVDDSVGVGGIGGVGVVGGGGYESLTLQTTPRGSQLKTSRAPAERASSVARAGGESRGTDARRRRRRWKRRKRYIDTERGGSRDGEGSGRESAWVGNRVPLLNKGRGSKLTSPRASDGERQPRRLVNEQGYDARIAQNHAQDDDQGSHPHHAVVIRVANDFP